MTDSMDYSAERFTPECLNVKQGKNQSLETQHLHVLAYTLLTVT